MRNTLGPHERKPKNGPASSVTASSGIKLGFTLLLATLAAMLPGQMSAQGVYSFTPTTPVNTTATQTVTVTLAYPGTISAIKVLTQGSAGLDYTNAGGGSCSVSAVVTLPLQCTVVVNFQPKYPGERHGAVVLAASDGTALGTEYLEGAGSGGLSVLTPGLITTVAGNINWIYSGDNVVATAAAIFLPMGEVTDAAGNLYIADTSNNRVRRVDAVTSIITTVAGNGVQGYTGDNGPATSASLSSPAALTLDGAGNLYIADTANYVVRMLNMGSGIITTIAGVAGGGTGGDGGLATAARLSTPGGLAFDAQHRLYVSDSGNNEIRRIDLGTGIITRFAGTGTKGYGGDGGQAASATFYDPQGISFGGDGSLYIADLGNNAVRKVAPSGTVTTVAGGVYNGLGDGGPATQAQLNLPAGVVVDQANNLYIADAGANRVRKVDGTTQIITTIAGNGAEQFVGDGGQSTLAELYGPYSLYYDGQGNLFVSDMFHNRVRKINGSAAVFAYGAIRVNRVSAPEDPIERLENDGNAVLNMTAPVLVNAALDAPTTTCTFPGPMAAGASCALGVDFAPTMLGNPVLGSVTLPSDAGNSPAVVKLSGQVLSVDPTTTTVTSSLNPSALGASITFTAHVTTTGTGLTGTVQFLDGTTVIGTGTLPSGSGTSKTTTFSTSGLALGPHSITAAYSGDSTNQATTSAVLTQNVKQPTTLLLSPSANPSIESFAVILTAKVTGNNSTPSGTVTFASGGVTLGTGTLDSTGTTTLSVSTLTIGTHPLTASYAGDTLNGPSNSNTIQQVVQGQGSSILLSTSSATVPVGTSVTFSVQVTGSNSKIPAGTVTFKDGTTTLGTGTLSSSAAASYSTATLAPGLHTITAVYAGDTSYASSTSAPLSETIQQIATVTTVSPGANPSAAGAVITLTATVAAAAPNPTGGAIVGTVTFMDGGTTLGTGTLSANGTATLSTPALPLGQSLLTAVFSGSPNYLASTSAPVLMTIQQAATAAALASSQNPSTMEDPITLTATVTTKGGKATGIVTFSNGGTAIGQGTLNAQGVATLVTSSLLVGQHGLVASYAGDALNLPSVSAALTQTVQLRPSTLVMTSSATSLNGGQQVTLISVVQWTGPIVPTGTVTFYAGKTVLGATEIDGTGVATLTIVPQVGLANVNSVYSGDSVFAGSTSAVIPITVGKPPLFTIDADQTAISLVRLQHMTVNVTIASEKGFSDKLALGCLGLPKAATCTFSVNQITLAANGSQKVQVVIDTGSPLTAGPVARNEAPRTSPGSLAALCGLPAGAFFCLLLQRGRSRVRGLATLLLLCVLGGVAGLTGCGTLTINGTPVGAYPFQITAAAQGAGVIQAVNMKLTVTQ